MAKSSATTVDEYLAELPADRRAVVAAVLAVVRDYLPPGYREGMNWGMIAFEVPLERFADSYNGQPLSYVAIAAQKNHFALYLNCVDAGSDRETALREAFAAVGKKLDMGKSCVRFKALADLELAAIGKIIAGTSVDEFVARYEASRKKH